MQTITTSPLNRRSSRQSASWRRMRQAQGYSAVPLMPSRRPHVSATTRALASALAPVALAGLFLLTGALSSVPLAQTHAAPPSSPASVTAVDLAALSDMQDMQSANAAQARSAITLRYRRGYSVQAGGWLCYGWPSGAYHCTQRWYRASSGTYVSRNPGWVPSQASGGVASAVGFSEMVSGSSAVSAMPWGLSAWAYTGRSSYREPSGGAQGYPWGWCTAGAAQMAHDNVRGLGNALDWTRHAAARGMATGTTPRAGATVVFQPGVQGASGLGHVAHVVAVYANGWFLIAETSFTWNGGGFGRVDYRYAHAGAGVSFVF